MARVASSDRIWAAMNIGVSSALVIAVFTHPLPAHINEKQSPYHSERLVVKVGAQKKPEQPNGTAHI